MRFAKHVLGISPIVADIDQAKWPLAVEAGATRAIDPSDPDAGKALMKATGGGVHAVVDFVGTGESFAFGFNALRKVPVGTSTPSPPDTVTVPRFEE